MTEAIATAAVAPPRYTRANPFPARLVVNRRLSGPESEKDTRHFELDLTEWGLSFEVGDSLAVYPTNDPQLVDEIIHALGATGDEQVPRPRGEPTTLREALLRDYSITQPTPKFLRAIAERASAAPTLGYLLAPDRKHDLETYLWGMEIIDFLLDHPSARFARICRSAEQPEQQERIGSFLGHSIKDAILPTARNSRRSRKRGFSHASIAHGHAIKPRRFMSSIE